MIFICPGSSAWIEHGTPNAGARGSNPLSGGLIYFLMRYFFFFAKLNCHIDIHFVKIYNGLIISLGFSFFSSFTIPKLLNNSISLATSPQFLSSIFANS